MFAQQSLNAASRLPPDLSIVIVNYNGAHLLADCLKSLPAGCGSLCHEVWVVDNGSSDQSLEVVRELCPQAHIITNAENRGFAAANNQALHVARGRHCLLLNSDTIVGPGALQAMVQAMDANPDLAGLGPRLLNRDGSIQPSCMHYPRLWRGLLNFSKAQRNQSGKYVPDEQVAISRVEAVTGACLLLRGAALETVGLLDEGYFMYAEETDWCTRAAEAGWAIGYLPAAEVVHLGGQTARREADRFYIERRYSRVRYYRKFRGRLAAAVDAAVIRGRILLLLVQQPRERSRHLALLAGFNKRVRHLTVGSAPVKQRQAARIVHISSVHPAYDTRILHRECRSLALNGYDVTLVVAGDANVVVDGVKIESVPRPSNRRERMLRTGRLVAAAARRLDADIVHLHDPELLFWTQGMRLRGRSVIYDMHENLPAAILDKPWVRPALRKPLSALSAAVERLLIRGMPVIFAEESYKASYPWIRNAETILNLPDLDRIGSYQAPRSEEFTVGYIGAVTPMRGSVVVLNALAILKREGLDIAFECIGPVQPAHEQELKRLIAQAGLNSVHLRGRERQDQALPRIAACHAGLALLQAKQNYVGSYPTKMFEYMALGIPVVVSDFPLYRAVVQRAGCGFCIDPDDATALADVLRLLQTNPRLGAEMGARGRQAALAHYNWQSEERKLVKLYERVLPPRRAHP